MQPDFLKGAGKLSEGIIAATMWDAAIGKNVPWIAKENDRHVARFGAPFTEDSAGYYQAFYVIVDALERTKKLGTKELRDAIAATNITDVNHKAMLLPYKQIKFDDTGQNPFATAMVVQTQGGKFRLLYPDSVAEPDAKLVWPYLGSGSLARLGATHAEFLAGHGQWPAHRRDLRPHRARPEHRVRHHARGELRPGRPAHGRHVHGLLALGAGRPAPVPVAAHHHSRCSSASAT